MRFQSYIQDQNGQKKPIRSLCESDETQRIMAYNAVQESGDIQGMDRTLTINGMVDSDLRLTYEDLSTRTDLQPTVTVELSGRQASGIPFVNLLKMAGVASTATHVTLHAEHDSFSASVPLSAVQDAAVIFEIQGSPIDVSKGGPFRFFIPN